MDKDSATSAFLIGVLVPTIMFLTAYVVQKRTESDIQIKIISQCRAFGYFLYEKDNTGFSCSELNVESSKTKKKFPGVYKGKKK